VGGTISLHHCKINGSIEDGGRNIKKVLECRGWLKKPERRRRTRRDKHNVTKQLSFKTKDGKGLQVGRLSWKKKRGRRAGEEKKEKRGGGIERKEEAEKKGLLAQSSPLLGVEKNMSRKE